MLRRSDACCYLVALVLGAVPMVAVAQDAGKPNPADLAKAFPSKPPYSPYAGRNYPTRPLFGDTHLHTSFSFDAGAFGARLTPARRVSFARGEEVTSTTGQPVKLSRPARLPRGRRPLRRHGLLPDLLRRATPS